MKKINKLEKNLTKLTNTQIDEYQSAWSNIWCNDLISTIFKLREIQMLHDMIKLNAAE